MQKTIILKPEQIPMDFPVRAAMGREDFMIGKSNQDAVIWIDQWPNWPAPVLFLSGPAASGKSHLAAVWTRQAKAVEISLRDLIDHDAESLAKVGEHIIIDGVDTWLGDRSVETTLFHLYNIFKEEHRTLMLTGRATPTEIDFAIPDLASRLRAAPCASIKSPDDDLLQNIIVKMFADRQIKIGEAELKYLMPRMERSFKFASSLVSKCDEIALSQKRPVTIAVIREALLALQEP